MPQRQKLATTKDCFPSTSVAIAAAALDFASACVSTPLRQIPPAIPESREDVMADANGGRVQSIAVNPTDRRNAIIAMQFGGIWKTYPHGTFTMDAKSGARTVTSTEFSRPHGGEESGR